MVHLDHIGIATDNIEKALDKYRDWGEIVHRGYSEKYKSECVFIQCENFQLEIFRSYDSRIERYVNQRGTCFTSYSYRRNWRT